MPDEKKHPLSPLPPDSGPAEPAPQLDETERQRTVNRLINDGARLLSSGRYAEALKPLQRAYELMPDHPDVAINLGGALILSHKWSRAVALLEEAVERHAHNPTLWINLAAAHLGTLAISTRPRQERAIEAYKRAIELDPTAPSAHYNIGLIYAERKDWPQAVSWFRAALDANPDDRDAALWLQRSQVKLSQASNR